MMQSHLDSGCKECQQVAALWSGVLETAATDDAFEPPQNLLRCARAMFAATRRLPKTRLLTGRLQILAPAMAGLRSDAHNMSHLLFKEGTLMLDVHLQPTSGSGRVALVGQLLDSARIGKRFENRSIALMREEDAVARTITNQAGEFSLEFNPGEDLMLLVELENSSYLVSRLPVPPEK